MGESFHCQICAADSLEEIPDYGMLARVTSDAKPWPNGGRLSVCHSCGAIQKLPDQKWRDEAALIYRNYEMYHLSQGAEQLVFADSGAVSPRSQRLVDYVAAQLKRAEGGKLIDIGCGNGDALTNFSRVLPDWKLYGTELTDRVLPSLQQIKNFAKLYTVSPGEIRERFSLVTMIHSLEHMPEPMTTLRNAARLMAEDGALFVEVPDIETSPFDLLVADHLMHFSRTSLGLLANRCGLAPTMLANDLIPKEITLLAQRGGGQRLEGAASACVGNARSTVRWLVDLMSQIRELSDKSAIGIFGTSVAGMALYGAFREQVRFFVDEDPSRIGRTYDGKPVIAPKDVPADVPVFMALPPNRAKKAAVRLASTGMRAVCPPPLTAEAMH
jgi:SAM-dependent methyltransferase